jgi:lichenan operon transcriptional antiterminator
MCYSGREKDIFKYLLNSNRCLFGNELAERCHVSSRTIRSDIKFLNKILKKYNIQISSNHKGYYISEEQKSIGNSIIEKIFNKESSLKIPVTPSERFAFIVYKLVFAIEFISMESLADILYVSKSTIYLDIQKVINFLKAIPKLTLEISPIKGLILKGDERSKRALISNILKREKNPDNLMLSMSFYYALDDENLDLDKEIIYLYEIVINTLHKFDYILTDSDFILLVKEILISIKRIQMGFSIEDDCEEKLDLTIAKSFKHEIEERFNIILDNKELIYLQQSFNSKRILNISNTKYVLREQGEEIVEEFIRRIKSEYYIDFSGNKSFKNNLMLHINPMIERLKVNHVEHNPLKDQIKSNYPFAFDIATMMAPVIKDKLNVIINESELSYIALHVAVALQEIYRKINIAIICGSGLGTASLIRSKILSKYSDKVNIVGYFPLYRLKSIVTKEKAVDLIITTIPLDVKARIPVIQVNPLITDEDLTRIKSYINDPLHGVEEGNYSDIIDKIFKKELFVYFQEKKKYLDAIRDLVKLLKMEGYIEDAGIFFDSVVKRENLYSTVLDNGLAIPHPMKSLSTTTVVAVGIFKNPVSYNDKKIKMIFLFAINAKEDEKLKVLYGIIEEIFDSRCKSDRLAVSSNFEEFIKILKNNRGGSIVENLIIMCSRHVYKSCGVKDEKMFGTGRKRLDYKI